MAVQYVDLDSKKKKKKKGLSADEDLALCGHFLFMNTWGFINSFGIFQTYYAEFLSRPPSDISWIGGIQVFLSFFVGAFIGRYIDSGHLRLMLCCGTTLVIVGIMTASVSTQYWQLLLSQGICCGLGNGFLVTPAVSVTSTYFARKRSLAIGIATCGSVTGGLVFSAMARQLLPSAGFGWAMRAIGFVQAVTLLFVIATMKTRLPPTKSTRIVEWVAFKELEYTFFTAGMFFVRPGSDSYRHLLMETCRTSGPSSLVTTTSLPTAGILSLPTSAIQTHSIFFSFSVELG